MRIKKMYDQHFAFGHPVVLTDDVIDLVIEITQTKQLIRGGYFSEKLEDLKLKVKTKTKELESHPEVNMRFDFGLWRVLNQMRPLPDEMKLALRERKGLNVSHYTDISKKPIRGVF